MKKRRARSDLDRAAARYTRQARREYLRVAQHQLELSAWHPNAPAWYRERIRCGAYARTTGKPCRKSGSGPHFRCRLHGSARRPPSPNMRAFFHDFFSRHGRRGAEIRWARVRAHGGLDDLTREFMAECGRIGGNTAGRGRPKKGQRR